MNLFGARDTETSRNRANKHCDYTPSVSYQNNPNIDIVSAGFILCGWDGGAASPFGLERSPTLTSDPSISKGLLRKNPSLGWTALFAASVFSLHKVILVIGLTQHVGWSLMRFS